jgi:hypothetical protein
MDKSTFVGQLINEALPALQLLVIALVGYLARQAATFLQQRVKSSKLADALLRANDTVWNVVLEMEQTLRREFELATGPDSEGGYTITPAEAAHLKSEALVKAKALLGAEGIKLIKEAFQLDGDGAIDAFLSTKIEASVAQFKLNKEASK